MSPQLSPVSPMIRAYHLSYYDSIKKTTIQVDISGHDIGETILQYDRSIDNGPKTLSSSETRYRKKYVAYILYIIGVT